ncbi:hypothetical protein EAF00_008923 [Botryotinia globosa]|nr:hypothetical protein EAF00_008923 [Botryotinia globosa]
MQQGMHCISRSSIRLVPIGAFLDVYFGFCSTRVRNVEYAAQSKIRKLIQRGGGCLKWNEIEDAKSLAVIHGNFLCEILKVARNSTQDIDVSHAKDSLSSVTNVDAVLS